MYTPFLQPRKAPEVNGVYRSKDSGKIMILKNMRLQGFIDSQTDEPYDGYIGKVWLESDGKEWLPRCVVTPETLQENWDKVVEL